MDDRRAKGIMRAAGSTGTRADVATLEPELWRAEPTLGAPAA
jgi:hypothetical protein